MSAAGSSVIIHGHFYQPPREDPWLGDVPAEPSAAPFHDWNQRIERECYRAVVAARIPGAAGRIARIVNTLSSISFDFGPTLLAWLETETPGTYRAVLAADQVSLGTLGFGNAMAMPYHHVILPLCSRRDKVTEVRWGMADFRRRFGREPDGMWLPEAAVDHETLDVLAELGIRFTVVGPAQVARAPAGGLPGRYRATGGRAITLFVYHGAISHDIAFGPLLQDATQWSRRMAPAGGSRPELVAVATDGESYGHHHRFGEMALAAVLQDLGSRADVRVENFASFLARRPPLEEVMLVSPSSWSCAHGVDRWRADCGCRVTRDPRIHQRWRAPLRESLDWLAGELARLYQQEGAALLGDPWAARDAYGETAALAGGTTDLPVRARELLELQRSALRMFTSCGWFFDDLGGIETVQVLRYAARAIELAGHDAPTLEAGLLRRLAHAASNQPEIGTGRDLYQRDVRPRVAPAMRAAAGFAAVRLLAPAVDGRLGGYELLNQPGSTVVQDRRTGRRSEFVIDVERPRLGQLKVAVTAPSPTGPIRLDLAELPERHQAILKPVLRRAIIERWFSARETGALTGGRVGLPGLARLALRRAVTQLHGHRAATAVEQVLDLADLLELLGLKIPFAAQTAFYRIWATAPSGQVGFLAPVAWRLGFTERP